MNTLTCLIVDDEPLARKLLEAYVAKVPSLQLLGSLSSGLAALGFLQEREVDLMFLDVQMPELTGVGLLKVLRKAPAVIFTTAYSDYAVEGYALDVADYLLKPITFERFLAAVERVSGNLRVEPKTGTAGLAEAPDRNESAAGFADTRPTETTAPAYLFVKDGNKSVRIETADIQWIEGLKDYVRIHTPTRKVTTLQSLKHLVNVLPGQDFVRIHHSTIIGVRWIEEAHRDEVQVAGTMLTISDSYRASFREFVARRELR